MKFSRYVAPTLFLLLIILFPAAAEKPAPVDDKTKVELLKDRARLSELISEYNQILSRKADIEREVPPLQKSYNERRQKLQAVVTGYILNSDQEWVEDRNRPPAKADGNGETPKPSPKAPPKSP